MAKMLKDKEMADIIYRAVHDDGEIICDDSYAHFLEDLAKLITKHFGGEVKNAPSYDEHDGLGWMAGFHVNECVPADGGIFAKYDTDVTWKNGEEVEE